MARDGKESNLKMLSVSVEWRQGFHGPASINILGVSSFSRGRGAKSQTEVGLSLRGQ